MVQLNNWGFGDSRPPLDMQTIRTIMKVWGFTADPLSVTDLGGAYNSNWQVVTPSESIVIRIRPPWLTPERLDGLHRLLGFLNREALPTPTLYRAPNGQTYQQVGGRWVEVYRYMPEAGNRAWSSERWEAAFAHLGRLHSVLARSNLRLKPPEICNYAPSNLLGVMLDTTAERLRALTADPEQAEALAIIAEAVRVMAAIDRYWLGRGDHLPQQLIHGDYHLDNLLFDAAHEVRYTLDFDFAAWGERLFDLAYALRLAMPQLTAAPDCALNSALIRAWLAAYDAQAEQPLRKIEREALPYQLAAVALYHIANACRAPDPLGQVLRESAYMELAAHLVQYPESLLECG